MLTNDSPFPRSFQIERFMTDLLADVRVTCPECNGYGWSPVEGCAVECDRCEGTGRIVPPTEHAAGLCLKPTCGEIRCVALRADILSRRAS